jgi:toxin-antitoxin system PIN domain toxin
LRHLLDVNVWIALLDEGHVHHAAALRFMQQRKLQIASCPLVENGVIRVLNLPGYSALGPVGFEAVSNKLRSICASLDHEFWPDGISLTDAGRIQWSRVLGHNQITDVYLLALAVAKGGCLVTLDHRVTLNTVHGAAARNLLLL